MSSPTQADANLWAAYGVALQTQLLKSTTLGQNQRFYIAPVSAAGIAAGKNIDMNITNMGVYNVGDSLLDLDSPVFLPTRQSYSQKSQLYAGQVFLNSDGNQGAAVRYQNAQGDFLKYQAAYTTAKTAAVTAWKSDTASGITTDPFWTWVATNAPAYGQALQAMNGASSACASAAAAISGQNAAQLGSIQNALTQAVGGNPVPGYNMQVSPAPANQIQAQQTGTPGAAYLEPAYTIDTNYPANVDNWISTFAQNKDSPITMSFNAGQSSSHSWESLGFDSSKVSVTGSYCIFFTVTYTENNTTVTKNMTAEEAGANLTVTITATSAGSYVITPGKWKPGSLWGMPVVSSADPSLSKPSAYVITAFLAYGVGMKVTADSHVMDTIHDYLQKASSSGGSASIFGYNIGLGGSPDTSNTSTTTFDSVNAASSASNVTIPPSDNAYPTLLAVVGEALPVPAPRPSSS